VRQYYLIIFYTYNWYVKNSYTQTCFLLNTHTHCFIWNDSQTFFWENRQVCYKDRSGRVAFDFY